MMHPLFRLVATQPQLLADHLEAYAELVSDEIGSAAGRWKRGLLLNAVAICCIGIGGVLAGVALMLWAVIPASSIQAPWALVAAPCVPLVVAVVCVLTARASAEHSALENVAAQVRADMAMFREASAA